MRYFLFPEVGWFPYKLYFLKRAFAIFHRFRIIVSIFHWVQVFCLIIFSFFCSLFSCFTTMSSRSLINLSASSNMLWFPLVCFHFSYCSLQLWLVLFYICISLLMFSVTFIHFLLISVILMTISLNSLYGKLPISIYLFFCSFLSFCRIFIWKVFFCLFILPNLPLVSTCCVYQPHLPVFKDL